MAIAFPPTRSISLTTEAAASAPFVYVMATFAPSAARRLAIAAPMPREPPVMSAIFPANFFDIVLLLEVLLLEQDVCSSGMSPNLIASPTHPKFTSSDALGGLSSHRREILCKLNSDAFGVCE